MRRQGRFIEPIKSNLINYSMTDTLTLKTSTANKRPRNSNLELYRIIVMLLIVAHHYVVNSGLLEAMEQYPLSERSLFFYTIGMWGKTGINCFVLITGYFMCKSEITIQKFLKLLFEVLFYKIVIYTIFIVSGYEHVTFKNLVFTILPIISISSDFVSCFLLFYLFIPFLNILVRNVNQKQHAAMLALCLFIYVVLGTVFYMRFDANYITWFCILYLLSSYIRFYSFPRISAWKYLAGGGHFVIFI